MFDDLFPRSSTHFQPFGLDASEWVNLSQVRLEYMWSVVVRCDDLMKRVASWRHPEDCFSSHRFVIQHRQMREELAMARGNGKAKNPIKDTDKAEWKGFLDFRLTDEQLAQLDEWKPRPQELWAAVDQMIGDGYRFTLSYNSSRELASCTIIDDNSSRKSGGFALSSSDTDGALALKMAVFKHGLLQGDWTPLLDSPQKRAQRG